MRPNNRQVDTNNALAAERRNPMICHNCSYWYADVDEKDGVPVSDPYCHYPYDDGYAPCEQEFDDIHSSDDYAD